ncbi:MULTISPECIES: sugar transferase [unclassified Fibrobacter]|uniref:sugar transferase n=1 Tax=unclassified Fibrobacter TaxID=2634177 RepID=UPI000D6C5630|nr:MULTISPECIES: sugar transferase [unclassified Fibrobacter]PWJ65527.1 Undecaprenyl-phosphate glucose phosphotransferase [Fibrobacter sp. UWR4]PZW72292.1 Undecaprenyl-phosphate glucose phosphotransferase [Fibrobacter sp. UWR1]
MIRATTLERILVILSDFVVLSICFGLAFWVQFHSGWIVDKFDPTKSFADYYHMGLVLNVAWLVLFTCAGLYRSWLLQSRTHQILRVIRAVVIGIVLIILCLFGAEFIGKVMSNEPLSSGYLYGSRFPWIFIYGGFSLSLVAVFRMAIYGCLRGLLRHGYGANNILVLGATEAGRKIAEDLARTPERGQRVIGFVDERFQVMEKEFAGAPVLGKYSDLPVLIKKYKVSGIIIAHESNSPQEIMRILVWICECPLHIYLVPELYQVISGQFKANLVYGFELQELLPFTMPPWQVRVKRVIDILFGTFLGICSLPICLLTALAIKLDDKGPIFYSQERIGLYGKPFYVYKFRTMRTDAEKFGAQWATKNDPRITRIGRFLRKTRIDELPQILCVLKGDMSMVGPRPERAVFIGKLREQIPFYISRLKMKPGLTGWAQVCHHYDTSTEDVKIKLKYDMYYYENMSLLLDFQILVRTVYVVLTGKGAQ